MDLTTLCNLIAAVCFAIVMLPAAADVLGQPPRRRQ